MFFLILSVFFIVILSILFSVILRDASPEESLRCFAPLNMTVKGTVILRDASPEESPFKHNAA